ncbi:MAG: Ni/Fe hydrogenase [Thermodesulfobacterium geofontis]|uniref:Ni/Fe hydrogenase n=2 Tax=Thermodesulfobacterium geofontis TaxID=1295609 RepID=A0A2N7PMR9_9BACT|nr:MAG: Ni/Fe hydrogenase [Thermodesulfobacterium geofontis]
MNFPSFDFELCFKCGACSGVCPVKKRFEEFDPRKMMHLLHLNLVDTSVEKLFWYCAQCGKCVPVCPMEVKPKEVIRIFRNSLMKRAFSKINPKPTFVWLHFMDCTGCSEALLRSDNPSIKDLLLDVINLEYHETLMAAGGKEAEKTLFQTIEKYKEKYFCVIEGAIPVKDGGVYCKIGGKTAKDILKKVANNAKLVISIGTCACFGGIPAAFPNPTGAVGVKDVIEKKKLINIPGCPPNPYNFLATLAYIFLFKKIPPLDDLGRPKFAYGELVHDLCERSDYYDEGKFAEAFGDEGHRKGYCLYKLGCKGLVTYANCPGIRFCGVQTWPVSIGHPCIGCTEPHFWDKMSPFYEPVEL